MSEYQFIAVEFQDRVPTGLRNTFVLKKNDWDDFGSHVRYDLFYFDGTGRRSQYGKLKLLHRVSYGTSHLVERDTTLPETFDALGEGYISLGQSQQYYEKLGMDFGAAGAIPILQALRDIAEMPAIASDFETSPPFRNGMMRENAARRARRFGRSWVRGEEVHLKPSFSYACEIGGGSIPTAAEFDFAPRDTLPSRVVAIIGRNAVGKTMYLSRLAADLAQIERISEERQLRKLKQFPRGRPEFARVIAVSYSAFDRFRRPEVTPYSSYVYCGIRDERGNMSQRALAQSYNRNRRRIREHERQREWTRYILDILSDAEGLSEDRLAAEIESEDASGLLADLSSGQAILCHFVTAILAWIEQESIILFDEPETHLHPNAIANLFLVLTSILDDYDS